MPRPAKPDIVKRHLSLKQDQDEFIRRRATEQDIESKRNGGPSVSDSDIVQAALAFYMQYPELVDNYLEGVGNVPPAEA